MGMFTQWLKCPAIALARLDKSHWETLRQERDLLLARRLFALPAKVVFAMRSHEQRRHIDLHTFEHKPHPA